MLVKGYKLSVMRWTHFLLCLVPQLLLHVGICLKLAHCSHFAFCSCWLLVYQVDLAQRLEKQATTYMFELFGEMPPFLSSLLFGLPSSGLHVLSTQSWPHLPRSPVTNNGCRLVTGVLPVGGAHVPPWAFLDTRDGNSDKLSKKVLAEVNNPWQGK